jgi:hypothetical protein
MVGHLQLQLRHYASAIVADRNISYGQMLRSGDTVPRDHVPVPQNPPHCAHPRALIGVRAHNGKFVCILYTEQVAALQYYNANALAMPAEYVRDY